MGISVSELVQLIKIAPPSAIIGAVGPPGFGKSSGFAQAVAEMSSENWVYIPIYTALLETVEINGCPHLVDKGNEKVGKWAPFEGLFPLETDHYFDDKVPYLVLDDLGHATPSVQKGCIRCAYGDGVVRKVGMQKLHPNTRVGFTSNLHTHRAGAHRFESYLANRVCTVEVEPSWNGYVTWAVEHNVNPTVVGYVGWTKTVTDFAPEKDAFMSPRSLTELGKMLDPLDKAGINGHVSRAVVYGYIGEQEGSKLVAFRALHTELPDMDAILGGRKVKLPERPEVQYMFVSSFLGAAQEKHVPVAASLITELTKTGGTGFEVAAFLTFEALKGGATKLRGIRTEPALYKWLGEYGKYLP